MKFKDTIERVDPKNPEHQKLYKAAYKTGKAMYGKGGSHPSPVPGYEDDGRLAFTPISDSYAKESHTITHTHLNNLVSTKRANQGKADYAPHREPYTGLGDYGFHPKTGKGYDMPEYGDTIHQFHARHADEEGKLHIYNPEYGIRIIHGPKPGKLSLTIPAKLNNRKFLRSLGKFALNPQYDYQTLD